MADVCIDDLTECCLDDLSTPGAFWLNPSLNRDASGNKVDPVTGLTYGPVEDEDEDEVLRRVLDDVDSR